jgi:transcription elongation factor Elf1
MPDTGSNGALNERINDRYWESDSTVGAISKELGVGRSALYAALVPIPSGATCLECGADTVFTNRTNRASGTAVCQSCEETERSESTAGTAGAERARGADAYEEASEVQRWERWREELRSVPPERAAMIGGAAAIGVLIGAVAARALRD